MTAPRNGPRLGHFRTDPRGGIWTDTNTYIHVTDAGVLIRHPGRRYHDHSPVQFIPRVEPDHRSEGWVSKAACTGLPTEIFFPPRGAETTVAKAICYQCPVRAQCLADANREPGREKHGIWGGLSERQRRNHQDPERWLEAG